MTGMLLQFHVVVSLVGIVSGLAVLYGLVTGKMVGGATVVFLTTTILTSFTGFFLAPFGFDPPRVVGLISLVLLAVAVVAFYAFHLVHAWRWIYVGTATVALYLNVFVGVIQAFQKLAFLHALAPTQSEAPFVVAQLATLVIFIALGALAAIRFHPAMKARM